MSLREIRYFLMVAECLNYSLAASRLYISQPSLSKIISNLEEDLGFKLLRRSTRKVELTEKGQRFYTFSKTYLEQCDKLAQEAETAEDVRGKLSIVYENTIDTSYIMFIIAAFQQKYPHVHLTVGKQKTEVLLQSLGTGRSHIGVMSSFAVPKTGFQSRLLFPYRLQVLVWKDHPLARSKHIKLSELTNENIVVLDPSISRSSKTILQMLSSIGLPLKESIYAANYRQMFLLTAQREGISFNLTLTNAAAYWDLVSVDVDLSDLPELESTVGMALAWREGNMTPAMERFFDIVDTLQISMPAAALLSDD